MRVHSTLYDVAPLTASHMTVIELSVAETCALGLSGIPAADASVVPETSADGALSGALVLRATTRK